MAGELDGTQTGQQGTEGTQSGGSSAGSGTAGGQGTTGEGQQGGTQGTGTSGQEQQGGGQGTASPELQFTFEPLRGLRTPAEVESHVRLLYDTVREQGANLNELTRRVVRGEAPAGGTTQERPHEVASDDDFWKNPTGVLQRMIDTSLAPFRVDGQRAGNASARASMAGQFGDFRALEPRIDYLLAQQGVKDTADENVLRSVYFMVKGMEAAGSSTAGPGPVTGGTGGGNMGGQQGGQGQGVVELPQHRASSTPLPNSGGAGGKQKIRELSEFEKRLARENQQTDEEYLAWLEMNAEDVATSNVGTPDWLKKGGQS